jgi:4-amino-4-deoxy-L-arabinose transferase-like glycosyltransferase
MINRLKTSIGRHYPVVFPLLLSIIVLWRSYRIPGLSGDAITYFQISRNILFAGKLGWEALWATPLHSVIIAATSYLTGIHDLLTVVSLVSPLHAFLLVLAVYSLAVQIFDRRTALLAATLTAIFPHLLSIAYSAEPEITYTLFLMLALSCFCAAIRRSSLILAGAAGVAFSLAYLSRSEGFLVMALLFIAISVIQGKRFYLSSVFRLCVVSTVLFFLVSSPYLLFLKQHYGTFVISPKSSYVMIWMKAAIYHDHNISEAMNPELWGLNSAGKLRWQEPKGIGDLFSYLMSHPGKSLSVYLTNLSQELPGRVSNNSGMEHFPQLFPIYLSLAALFTVFRQWGPFSREKKAILLAPLLIFLVLPIFTGGWWKYLVPYLPLILIMAAHGICSLAALAATKINAKKQEKVAGMLVMIVAALVVIRFYLAFHPINVQKSAPVTTDILLRRQAAEACKDLGILARQRFGPGRNYLAPWSKFVYYLDGFWTPKPLGTDTELLTYAKTHEVDYLVNEALSQEEIQKLYNQAPPPGFEVVGILRSSRADYALAFYRLQKETQ